MGFLALCRCAPEKKSTRVFLRGILTPGMYPVGISDDFGRSVEFSLWLFMDLV
jgi:hypothetical protein